MKTKEEISDKVVDLIEKNIDSYQGFLKASKKVEDMNLRDYLVDQATDRMLFAEELANELKSYNPDVKLDDYGTLSGSFHQSWLDIKALLAGNTDKAVLEECMRGDKVSMKDYETFLKEYSASSSKFESIVNNQLQKIIDSLDNQFRLENISR